MIQPSKNDVLSGRGSGVNSWEGNIFYRKLVSERKQLYTSVKRNEKNPIAKEIISIIHSLNPRGRFLTRDRSGQWIELSMADTMNKTSQALREGQAKRKSLILKSHNKKMTDESKASLHQVNIQMEHQSSLSSSSSKTNDHDHEDESTEPVDEVGKDHNTKVVNAHSYLFKNNETAIEKKLETLNEEESKRKTVRHPTPTVSRDRDMREKSCVPIKPLLLNTSHLEKFNSTNENQEKNVDSNERNIRSDSSSSESSTQTDEDTTSPGSDYSHVNPSYQSSKTNNENNLSNQSINARFDDPVEEMDSPLRTFLASIKKKRRLISPF